MPRGRIAKPIAERLTASYRVSDDGCWEWQLQRNPQGYGRVRHAGRSWLAHRLSYETFVGPIPDGLVLDHLCCNQCCINPAHLEPVTPAENLRRWSETVTHCPEGHPYEGHNLYIDSTRPHRKFCRTCRRRWALNYYYSQGATPAERTAKSAWGRNRQLQSRTETTQ